MSTPFGATILQVVSYPRLRDHFRFAESIGLDNAWVIDQFEIDGVPEVPMLEAWTALAAVAEATDRIRIGTLVTNVAMRNPGLLAKSVLTVDQISDGESRQPWEAGSTRLNTTPWVSTSSTGLHALGGCGKRWQSWTWHCGVRS